MTIIDNADDCNINRFMKCLFDKKLHVLCIKEQGDTEPPDPVALENAWAEIWIEWIDLSKPDLPEIVKNRQIQLLDSSIQTINLCFTAIDSLIRIYDGEERVVNNIVETLGILKTNGIKMRWNDDIDDLKKQFAGEQIRYKNKYVQLEDLKAELKDAQKVNITPLTKELFLRKVNSVKSLLNVPISLTDTMVSELAVMFAEYDEVGIKNSMN